jgi:hypothetical protein
MLVSIAGFAGHRVRVPPDPIPNSEVKPCSVPRCIVVFGHEKPGKLATHFTPSKVWFDLAKLYNSAIIVLKRNDGGKTCQHKCPF